MFEPIPGMLRRHRWLACVAFLIPFTIAVVLAATLPGLYRAAATILVQTEPDPGATGAGSQPADVETRLQTIREEVLSRQRLDAMVDRFRLYPDSGRDVSREAIIDRMRKDIKIELKGSQSAAAPASTIAFTLGFRGADRILTAAVANALAESYVQENLKIRGRQTRSAADALGAQLGEVRARLDEQEAGIGRYQAAHNGELPQQLIVNLARMQQLETQLQLNREGRLRAMDRRDISSRLASDPRDSATPGNAEPSAARLARLKRDLEDLRLTYSDKYPEVARVREEIAVLESRQQNEPADTRARRPRAVQPPADVDMRGFENEEDRLRREIDTYSGRVDRAPLREQEFARMSRDYSTTKELYGSLLKRYQEAKIADDLERDNKGGQLRILDAAIAPRSPYAPDRRLLMLLALFGSLAFAAGSVALADRIDTSFHTVDDLRSFTRVPVLVSIPPLKTSAARWKGRRRFVWMALATVSGILLIGVATWSFAHGNAELVQLFARGSAS